MARLLGLLALVLTAKADAPPSPADCFPLRKGLSWLYEKRSNITTSPVGYGLEVIGSVEVNGEPAWEVATTDADKGGKSHYRVDAKGVYVVALGDPPVVLTPPMPLLVAPLKTGTKWSWTGELPLSQGSIACKVESRVAATERILTLGKQIDCIRVESKSQLGTGKAAVAVSRTSWYAPNVGLVKEHTEYRDGKDKLTETVLLTRFSGDLPP